MGSTLALTQKAILNVHVCEFYLCFKRQNCKNMWYYYFLFFEADEANQFFNKMFVKYLNILYFSKPLRLLGNLMLMQ